VAESCNGRDDDCDASIDEDVDCEACTTPSSCDPCVRFVARGVVYQSCPAMSGLEYWRRTCWTLGDGYELAVLEDPTESDAVAAAIRADSAIDEAHWIGVNDFEADGTYVTVGGGRLAWSPSFADVLSPIAEEGFVALEPDGLWEDETGAPDRRALCELGPAGTGRRCATPGASTDGCDGRDQDCDGFVDEDCTGTASCSARVFWSSVYYLCTDDLTFAAATSTCAGMSGAYPARLDHRFELEFAASYTTIDTWVGLSQDAAGTEPAGGWAWGTTSFTSSDPDWSAMWDAAQPSSMAMEDCGFLKDSTSRLQDHDCAMNRSGPMCELPLP
jgi:hypothetical protein